MRFSAFLSVAFFVLGWVVFLVEGFLQSGPPNLVPPLLWFCSLIVLWFDGDGKEGRGERPAPGLGGAA